MCASVVSLSSSSSVHSLSLTHTMTPPRPSAHALIGGSVIKPGKAVTQLSPSLHCFVYRKLWQGWVGGTAELPLSFIYATIAYSSTCIVLLYNNLPSPFPGFLWLKQQVMCDWSLLFRQWRNLPVWHKAAGLPPRKSFVPRWQSNTDPDASHLVTFLGNICVHF